MTTAKKQTDTKELGTQNIWKLIAKYSIPAVVASFINAIYNIVDRIFLGLYENEDVLGGLQAGFPIMLFMLGVGLLCSIGFSTLSSIFLGRKNEEGARKIFTNGLVVVLIFTVLLTVLGAVLISPLLRMTGATSSNLKYAEDYMLIIIYAQFFQMMSLYLSNYARIEGRPNLSMISQIVAACVNIVLDYVFIGPLGLGVKGAAYATIIGLFVGMAILAVYYIFSKKTIFRINVKMFKLDFRMIGGALAIGLSSFVLQVGNVVSNIVINNQLVKYGSDAALNAMAAMASLVTIAFMPLIGLKDGVVPIIGYNYGAGQIQRAKKTLLYSILVGCIFSTVIAIVIHIWPKALMSMFIRPESQTMEVAMPAVHMIFAMLPLLAVNICGTSYLQSTKRTLLAFIASVSRQIVFLVPLALTLPLGLGLQGVWLTFPLSDVLSIVLTIGLILLAFRKQRAPQVSTPLTDENIVEPYSPEGDTIEVTPVESLQDCDYVPPVESSQSQNGKD